MTQFIQLGLVAVQLADAATQLTRFLDKRLTEEEKNEIMRQANRSDQRYDDYVAKIRGQ